MKDFSAIDLKTLAFLVYNTLKEHGIEAILVGGACVSIYSENRYMSYDLDFVTYEDLKKVEKPLETLGFKRVGRCFTHEKCPYLIDFVNPPIAVGHEAIRSFETLRSGSGILKLLTQTDCVKDRLAAYFYWGDPQSLEQARLVAKNHPLDIKNLTAWAKKEGHLEQLERFLGSIETERDAL